MAKGPLVIVGGAYVLVAAILNGLISAAGNPSFDQQLLLTIITGIISAGGLVLGAWMSTRSSRESKQIAEENKKLLEQHGKQLAGIRGEQQRLEETTTPEAS